MMMMMMTMMITLLIVMTSVVCAAGAEAAAICSEHISGDLQAVTAAWAISQVQKGGSHVAATHRYLMQLATFKLQLLTVAICVKAWCTMCSLQHLVLLVQTKSPSVCHALHSSFAMQTMSQCFSNKHTQCDEVMHHSLTVLRTSSSVC